MKRFIALILVFSTVLLGGSALFIFGRLDSFFVVPTLEPKREAIPSSYFGMTVHNYPTTTPWPTIPFASLRTWDTPNLSWADINQALECF